jgi:hypothetical protein
MTSLDETIARSEICRVGRSLFDRGYVHDPHAHTSLVACSLKAFEANGRLDEEAELLPPITPYFVMKVGRVPHIPYHRPGADEAAEAVAQAIARHASHGRHIRAVMQLGTVPRIRRREETQRMGASAGPLA